MTPVPRIYNRNNTFKKHPKKIKKTTTKKYGSDYLSFLNMQIKFKVLEAFLYFHLYTVLTELMK